MIATAKTKKNEVIQSYKRAYYSNIKFFQTIKSMIRKPMVEDLRSFDASFCFGHILALTPFSSFLGKDFPG